MNEFFDDIDIESIGRDLKRLQQQPQQDKRPRSDKFVVYPEKEGVLLVRILPAAPGARFYETVRTHYVNGKTLYCPMVFVGERWKGECPSCMKYNYFFEEAKRAKTKEEAETLRDRGRKFKPTEKNYYNCIVREEYDDNNKLVYNVGPKVLSVGKKLQQRVLRAIFGDEVAREPRLGNVAHPMTGRDFKIVKRMAKSPDGEWANYDDSKFLDPSALGTPDQIHQWLGNMHDLKALVTDVAKSFDEIQAEVNEYLSKILGNHGSGNDESFEPRSFASERAPERTHVEPAKAEPVVELQKAAEEFGGIEESFLRELQQTIRR